MFLETIAPKNIRTSDTNPRQSIDDAALDELKASIAATGINVPLLVRPRLDEDGNNVELGVEPQYELVAGERRYMCAIALGLETVPCVVRSLNDAEARDVQIIENLQRADVHPAEEADAYGLLIKDAAAEGLVLTAEDIAKRLGKPTSYVAQRLKLRELMLDAKLLYMKGHITLGHALQLAKLTPHDQARAIRFMLDSDPKYDKRDLTEIIRGKLGIKVAAEEPEDSCEMEDEDEDEQVSYNMPNPQLVKYMRHGRRLVDATEAQLKKWIEGNVLLKLADVPWQLDDAELVIAAGACTTCPKRSGSNAALFSDLTSAEDVCLDTVCFAAKQKATMIHHREAGKKSGGLLKLSAKASTQKMDAPYVDSNGVLSKKAVKAGQWLMADRESCKDVVVGLMVDGPDQGKLVSACANQGCKVHKHQVSSTSSSHHGGGFDYEAQRKIDREKGDEYLAIELPIRKAVYSEIKAKGELQADQILRRLIGEVVSDAEGVCELAGIAFQKSKDSWQRRSVAKKSFLASLEQAAGNDLLALAFDALSVEAVEVHSHHYKNVKGDRADLWKLAKAHGVDPDAIVKQMTPKPVKAKPVAPAKSSKVVAKKAVKGAKAPVSKKLSPESRKRIADAMTPRFEARRKAAAK